MEGVSHLLFLCGDAELGELSPVAELENNVFQFFLHLPLLSTACVVTILRLTGMLFLPVSRVARIEGPGGALVFQWIMDDYGTDNGDRCVCAYITTIQAFCFYCVAICLPHSSSASYSCGPSRTV